MNHWAQNGMRRAILTIAMLSTPLLAQAYHVGEALTVDRQLSSASDQFLAALSQWEKLPPSLKASNLAGLVQLAQARQQLMIALVQADAKVAAARMLPKAVRARIPAQAAVYVESEVRVQGTGFVSVKDNFARGTSIATLKIRGSANDAPQSVYLADSIGKEKERDLQKLAGKKLTFNAMHVGDLLLLLDKKNVQIQQLQAADGTTTSIATFAAAGTPVQGDQKTLSILVNFIDKPLACSTSDMTNRLFGSTGATVNSIYKDSSRGLVSFSGNVVGPFTINYASTGACDFSGWAAAAEAAATAAGIDPSQYTRVNYVSPMNYTCGWAGMAYMPGRQSWVQACDVTGIFAHELGHNITLHHAATPTAEYGDGSDPMGGGEAVGHNGANRVMAGWQPAGTVLDVVSGGAYSVATLSNGNIVSTPQVLRLAKSDTAESYYISMRQAIATDTGLDPAFVNAISVHRAGGSLPIKTYLMQILGAGQSFNDAINGISITNQGVTNGVANVAVTMTSPVCSRSAPSVSLAPSTQSANAGSTVNYAVTVKNNNTPACGTSTFSLSQSLPVGFSGALSAPSLALGAGASGSINWSAASAATVKGGIYGLDISTTDTSASTGLAASTITNHASYVVVSDTTPPTVNIKSPGNGSTLAISKPLSITVLAGDASGVQSVAIYADGVLLARDTGAPFTANWNARKAGKGAHTITARATDNAGNVAEQTISVTLN